MRSLNTLWADDAGSVIALEYLGLATVVGLGGMAGMANLRDAMNEEFVDFGRAVKAARRYAPPAAVSPAPVAPVASPIAGGYTFNDPTAVSP